MDQLSCPNAESVTGIFVQGDENIQIVLLDFARPQAYIKIY